jgi:hypothetical protein
MISVDNVIFDFPDEAPVRIAERLEGALSRVEKKEDGGLLRLIFIVSPTLRAVRGKNLAELKNHMEPYRFRVKHACLENIIVVENPVARVAAKAAVNFLRPDVPTKVVRSYSA